MNFLDIFIASIVLGVGLLLWPIKKRMWENYQGKSTWLIWYIGITVTVTLLICLYFSLTRK